MSNGSKKAKTNNVVLRVSFYAFGMISKGFGKVKIVSRCEGVT